MGQYYNVNEDISELLDYLQLYREIIHQGLIDEHYLKHIDALVKEIDTLEAMAENGEDISSYNFASLNKKIGAVFHPDRCHIDFNSLGYPIDMYGKATGIVQDLAKYQRESNFAFKYNSTATSSESKKKNGNSTSSAQSNYYTYTGENKRKNTTSSTQNNNYYSNNYSKKDTRNDHYDYSDFNTSYTITDFLKDRFYAIFAGIPSCKEDYDKIKERLDKNIASAKLRLSAIQQRISILNHNKNYNKVEWVNATRDSLIEAMYNDRYYSLYNSFFNSQAMQRQAENNRGFRYSQLTPQIQTMYQQWQRDAEVFYNKYQNLLYIYNEKMCSFEPMEEKEMHQQILELRQYYLNYYYDPNKAFNGIMRQVLNNDPDYCSLAKEAETATIQFQKADATLRDYAMNKNKYKAEIKQKLDDEYQKKDEYFEAELKKAYAREGKVSRKLNDLEAKHTEFVQQYGSTYDSTINSHKSK